MSYLVRYSAIPLKRLAHDPHTRNRIDPGLRLRQDRLYHPAVYRFVRAFSCAWQRFA